MRAMDSINTRIDNLLPHRLPRPLTRMLSRSGLPKVIERLPGLDKFVWQSGPFWEPDVCAMIQRFVKPGWICVDVGANIGRMTLLLARLVGPYGRVIAFEPLPSNARLLQEKCAFWHYRERVRVENMAVSDGSDDHLWLFPGRGRGCAEWNIMGYDINGNKTEPEMEIAATSLDAYFPVSSHLDLVKIDVEGAEAKVLAGMRRLLHEARPIVLVEFHDEVGWDGRWELLSQHYRLYDMSLRRLAPSSQWVYHVLGLPQEWGT